MESMGIPVDELVLFGGGARSSLWTQIISDVTGKPASATAMVDVANWGACILAGQAANFFDQDPVSRSDNNKILGTWTPQPASTARYEEIYHRYQALEQRLCRQDA
jgi:sugar (pentulose or hexulose) kinase